MFEECKGSTGETFNGMIHMMERLQPPWFVWENVTDLLDQGQEDNLFLLQEALDAIGYTVAHHKVNSLHYGLPQDRERLYGVCVNRNIVRMNRKDARALVERVLETVSNMKLAQPLHLSQFLLDDDDPYINECLSSLQETKSRRKEHGVEEDLLWRRKLQALCLQHQVRLSALKPSKDLVDNSWFHALPLREQQGLLFQTATCPDMRAVDLSQSIERMCPKTSDVLGTLLPCARWFLIRGSRSRILTGLEAMRAQGSPLDLLQELSNKPQVKCDADSLFSDLAGNAFSAPVVAAHMISVILHSTGAQLAHMQGQPAGDTGSTCSASSSAHPDAEVDDLIASIIAA